MGQVVMFAGSRVGTGKTTTTMMTALAANRLFEQRVLLIDATSTLELTQTVNQVFNYESSANLLTGLAVQNLAKVVTPLREQLDFIPGVDKLEDYFDMAMEAEATAKTARTLYLVPQLMADLRHQYDYIFIDTDADFATVMDNCLASTDYVVIMQPVGHGGFDATDKLFYYLKQLKEEQPTVRATIIGHLAVDLASAEPFYQVEPASSFDVVDAFRVVITRNAWLVESQPFAPNATHATAARQMAGAMYAEVFNELQARVTLQKQLGKFANANGITERGQGVHLFS